MPVLVAVGMLAVAGCSASDEPETSAPASSAPASDAPSTSASPEAPSSESPAPDAPEIVPGATAEALAGTSWFGTAEGVAEVTFTLNADGTVDFASFNGQPYDSPTDVWSVDGETFSLTISQLQSPAGAVADIVFTGTSATGGMELVGDDGSGTTYPMTIVQA